MSNSLVSIVYHIKLLSVGPNSLPVNLGKLAGKMTTGSSTLNSVKEDKKNKVIPGFLSFFFDFIYVTLGMQNNNQVTAALFEQISESRSQI